MGESEGMDTSQEEQIDSMPLAQRIQKKKRKIDGTSENSDEAQSLEDSKTQKPSTGSNREGIKNLRFDEMGKEPKQVLHHSPHKPKEGNGHTEPDFLDELRRQ